MGGGSATNNNNNNNGNNNNSNNNNGSSGVVNRKKSTADIVSVNTGIGATAGSNSTASGAAARQLVQTLVDNGIISPGNKSTIRVVDTLNLGTSQVFYFFKIIIVISV